MADLPYAKLAGISYSVASDNDRKVGSAAKITDPLLGAHGSSQTGTLFDKRLGVNNDRDICATCANNQRNCQQHFGVIQLAVPMINPHRQIFLELLRWLCVTCMYCGHFMVSDPSTIDGWARMGGSGRLKAMANLPAIKLLRVNESSLAKLRVDKQMVKIPNCPSCGRTHPVLMAQPTKNRSQIYAYVPEIGLYEKDVVPLTPVLVLQAVSRVTEQQVRVLSYNPALYHPRNFVKTFIEVMPVNLRNTQIASGNGKTYSDHFTRVYTGIIKLNGALAQSKDLFVEDIGSVLSSGADVATTMRVTTLIEALKKINQIANVYYSFLTGQHTATDERQYGAPAAEMAETSLSKVLHGKHGAWRKDGLASRTHNRARLVIYNNPYIRIDQVLLPLFVLKRLRRRETVTERNYEDLRRLLLNGKDVYPGIFEIVRLDGKRFMIESIDVTTFDLQIGDRVYRTLREGEKIMLNRQPSTKLTNIGAHTIRLDPDPDNFGMGMNIEACDLYSADFDGDQMTLLTLMSTGAVVEQETLTTVRNNFISEQTSSPNWGLSQDGRTMIAELTRSSVRLSRREAQIVCENVSKFLIFDQPFYTGREIVSMLLPKFNYRKDSSIGKSTIAQFINLPDDERTVVIVDGRVLSGVFDKSIVAPVKDSIFDRIFALYGIEETITTIYNLQHAAISFSRLAMFTISPRDFVIEDAAAIGEIHQQIHKTLFAASPIIHQLEHGLITAPQGKTMKEHFENKMMAILSVDTLKPVGQSLSASSLLAMILYGSRGNLPNMTQITAVVGQTILNGKRIADNFDYNRMNIYTQRCDLTPEARGFITDPFAKGLKPPQFLMGAQEGRSTIIKKALATSVAGAMCRQMVRNLESLTVNSWHVIVCNTKVVQWIFGDNNFDPKLTFEYPIASVDGSDASFEKLYFEGAAKVAPKSEALKEALAAEERLLRRDRAEYRANMMAIQYMNGKQMWTAKQRLPLNLPMVLEVFVAKYQGGVAHAATEEELLTMMGRVVELNRWFARSSFNDNMASTNIPLHFSNAYRYMQIYMRSCLPSGVLRGLRLATFDALVAEIRARFLNALIQPGDAIGIRDATATSEPTTQAQLDSHHMTGDERLTKYLLKDITNHLSAKDTTLSGQAKMWIRLDPSIERNEMEAEKIAIFLQVVKLREFMESVQLFVEPFGLPQHPKYAAEKVLYERFAALNALKPSTVKKSALGSYCIRVGLSRRRMLAKNISIADIVTQLYHLYPTLFIVHNVMNDVEFGPVLRIHLTQAAMKSFGVGMILDRMIAFVGRLLDTTVRGVEGITEAHATRLFEFRPDDADGASAGTMKTTEIWVIRTQGSNAIGVSRVRGVDVNGIETNSMHETVRLWGLLYGRSRITQEWGKIVEDFPPSYFMLTTDVVLSTGRITPINFSGNMMREPKNILLNMGTGKAMYVLGRAGMNGTYNPIYGMSGPMLMGQTVDHGSGFVDCMYDSEFIAAHKGIMSESLL